MRNTRSPGRVSAAVAGATAVHLALFMLLLARTGSTGLAVEHDGRGKGIVVGLVHPPRAASRDGLRQAQVSDPAPPHPPVLARPALEADLTPSLDPPDPTSSPAADPSPPGAAAALPSSAPTAASRFALLPPPAPPAANPWSQASYQPQASAGLMLDLWPQVAPCWRGPPPGQPIRLRLTLDPFGVLLSADLLEDDEADATPSPQALVAAKAAAKACSPYVQRGDAHALEVIFPVGPPSSLGRTVAPGQAPA